MKPFYSLGTKNIRMRISDIAIFLGKFCPHNVGFTRTTQSVSLPLSGKEANPPLKLKVDKVAVLVIGRPSDEVTVCVCVCVLR